MSRLGLDATELASCVGCGLCLPHCPTFRVTGEEGLSPRGRIDAIRAVEWRDAPVDDDFLHFTETCVQCRGCEPACPSGVPFGHLIEGTKATLAAERIITPRWQRLAYRVLRHHRSLLVGSTVLALAQRMRLVPKRAGLAPLPLRRGALPDGTAPTGTDPDVWLFTGCVMDAWMRSTHRATAALVRATGHSFRWSSSAAGCCGALHVHAGLHDEAGDLARRVMEALPGNATVLVNSAGCGAALKDYGHLLGTAEAATFSARVLDINEWLADHVDELPSARAPLGPVVVQDPCHLRHVQRRHESVWTVLARYAELIELYDDGVCCGAGGAYSALQPELAGAVRERKLAAIARATEGIGPTVVASANPGCAMHLAAAGLHVEHPVDLVARAAGLLS
ncbi:heterodisulfide reductase-related iron-sulfur binding cluster [soil metagenome]